MCQNTGILYILTYTCASGHSGVQFFNIGTAKSGPDLTCFVHFDFKMCFSPQRRAVFQHRNGKKWSGPDVFCAFWLQNVLLATAACNFSTSQLQKMVRTCSVLYILTSKCASRHSGVQFLISPLTTWLRTRRFNEPTFRLTRHTNHWKNTAFRDFSNIWRGWIFFLLTFGLLHLLSSDSTSSSHFTFLWLYFIYLLFICFSTLHIVGSLLFKLPSIIFYHNITYDIISYCIRFYFYLYYIYIWHDIKLWFIIFCYTILCFSFVISYDIIWLFIILDGVSVILFSIISYYIFYSLGKCIILCCFVL